MKLSEYINELDEIKEKYGDIEIDSNGPDAYMYETEIDKDSKKKVKIYRVIP